MDQWGGSQHVRSSAAPRTTISLRCLSPLSLIPEDGELISPLLSLKHRMSFSCLNVEIHSVKHTIWRVCVALFTLLWHNDMNHLSVMSELNSGLNWSSVCRTLGVNCSQRSRCSFVTPDKLKSPSSEYRPIKCFWEKRFNSTSLTSREDVQWSQNSSFWCLFSFHCWCFYL